MAVKVMALRRPDQCSTCGVDLPAGTRAAWDGTARHVTCLACLDARVEPQPAQSTDPVETEPIDLGIAGASARATVEQRRENNRRKVEERWGTGGIGKIALLLSDDPQSTKAWGQGAAGEERFASLLADRLGGQAVLLHDRSVPRTRGNIDHIAVTPNGVWVIDTKRYKGKVTFRPVGPMLRKEVHLYVDGRDRMKLVDAMSWQRDAVVEALDGIAVPVHQALAFIGAEWDLLAGPKILRGVHVAPPRRLTRLIGAEGALPASVVEDVARRLAGQLPAYRP